MTFQFQYPDNLQESGGGHCIQFFIVKDTPIKYQEMTKKGINSAGSSLMEKGSNLIDNYKKNGLINTLADVGQQVFSETSVGKAIGAAKTIADTASSAAKYLGGSEKTIDMHKNASNLIGCINLFMPDTINLNQSQNWQTVSLTEIFGNVGLGGQVGKSLYDSGVNGGEAGRNALSSNESLAPGAIETAGAFGGKAMDKMGMDSEAARDYALSLGGFAINPQLELLYKGLGLRTFQFDFTFIPRSQKEAIQVKNIITAFRKYSSPIIDTTVAGGSRYFKVPNKFEIEYQYRGKHNSYLHKIAPCVLQTVSVDYSSRGWTAFHDGAPVQTRMTLQFQEILIIDQDKIDKGF